MGGYKNWGMSRWADKRVHERAEERTGPYHHNCWNPRDLMIGL